jgi:hypothetical protein
LIELHRPPQPVANIPSAFGFDWTAAGTTTLAAGPANWPTFPFTGNERDHRHRLVACRVLAEDLLSDIKPIMGHDFA